jgi:hypothetical protein
MRTSFSLSNLLDWFVRSKVRIALAMVLCFVITGMIDLWLNFYVMHDPESHLAFLVLDMSWTGVLSSAVLWLSLYGGWRRRQRVLHYVRQVDELNHHIRNALQAIVLHSQSQEHLENIEAIQDFIHRIEVTLQTAFPTVGDRNVEREKTFHALTD